MPALPLLLSDDTVIVLAQALTGLGHLRVTHALYHGLPDGAHATLLSSQDETVNYMHKITSINPALRSLMEFTQNGWAEDVFTWFARRYFRGNTTLLVKQLQTILDQQIIHPRRLLLVATHNNLAHQLAAIQNRFAQKNNIAVKLVVVVTDDSPQHLWAVGGADVIVVPSIRTKHALEAYSRSQADMPPTRYVVLPYMVSPRLSTKITPNEFSRRIRELDPMETAALHVSVPISGAAVQLVYFEKLISYLQATSKRYSFHIVSHQSPSTARFISRMNGKSGVTVSVSTSHRDVVELYEELYENETIALEITKPSEQAFKSLLNPLRRGGAILLFSNPVGRQEYDNLDFLLRHGLVPTQREQERLWSQAAEGGKLGAELASRAGRWRGVLLPLHSLASAKFISWCLNEGVFMRMAHFEGFEKNPELASDGVEQFWKMMEDLCIRCNEAVNQKSSG